MLAPDPVSLVVPADASMIGFVQNATKWFSDQAQMTEKQCFAINLSIEELVLMLLRYSFDDGREAGELEITLDLDSTRLRMEIACRALPFDLSMVPEYDPEDISDDASLSALLLKHMVDRYRLRNTGKDGYRVELEWLRPLRHIAEMEEVAPEPGSASAHHEAASATASPPPAIDLRPLTDHDALALARLVYRSYGYSYVSEYLYYPERIAAKLRDGTLESWVLATADGQLAAHAALMRNVPDAPAVEWGIAVVDPRWRGQGLMKQVSTAVIQHAANSNASVLFAHAVSNHPYTQKACIDLGLVSTALLLGFAPASLKFRNINNALAQRESIFIALVLLKPLPSMPVHLPPRHAQALHRLAQGAGIPLTEAPVSDHQPQLAAATVFDSVIEPAVNAAFINPGAVGPDHVAALARERRRLCREKVDVIYLNIDLSHPSAPLLTAAAEAEGFFFGGLCPMQPWPYTLTLQYLNNLTMNYETIHAVSEQAAWLKALVQDEQQRQE